MGILRGRVTSAITKTGFLRGIAASRDRDDIKLDALSKRTHLETEAQ